MRNENIKHKWKYKTRNENIKHKNTVKILKAISSLQDVFSATTLISLPWGMRGIAAVELKWVQVSMYKVGITGKVWWQLILLWNTKHFNCDFFGALLLFPFFLSSSGCSLFENQWFYSHMKPKFAVESYCLEGWRSGSQYDMVLNPQISHSYRE